MFSLLFLIFMNLCPFSFLLINLTVNFVNLLNNQVCFLNSFVYFFYSHYIHSPLAIFFVGFVCFFLDWGFYPVALED